MPSLAKRSCPGCGRAVTSGRCSECLKRRDTSRGTAKQRGYDSSHQRLRVLAFQRDAWKCVDCGWRPQIIVDCESYGIPEPPLQIILDSLTDAYHRGDTILHGDHIIPIDVRPELAHVLENYATRCNRCHDRKTKRGDVIVPNKVTLVCGPPGSGKSTYVAQRRSAADLVWDFDALMHALTGATLHHAPVNAVRYVRAMRESFYAEAAKSHGDCVWVIDSARTHDERVRLQHLLKAELVYLDVPMEVCIERTRSRGAEWADIVRRWFQG